MSVSLVCLYMLKNKVWFGYGLEISYSHIEYWPNGYTVMFGVGGAGGQIISTFLGFGWFEFGVGLWEDLDVALVWLAVAFFPSLMDVWTTGAGGVGAG